MERSHKTLFKFRFKNFQYWKIIEKMKKNFRINILIQKINKTLNLANTPIRVILPP